MLNIPIQYPIGNCRYLIKYIIISYIFSFIFPFDISIFRILHRIGWWENFPRKTLYLMVKTMVSCRFSQPIQWFQYNPSSSSTKPPGELPIVHLPGPLLGADPLARRAPRGGPGHLSPRRGAGAGAVEGDAHAETMGSRLKNGVELQIHNTYVGF